MNKENDGWIELNLPWHVTLGDRSGYPTPPNINLINKRWVNEYGKLPIDVANEMIKKKEKKAGVRFYWSSAVYVKFEEIHCDITEKLLADGFNDENINEERRKRLLALNDKDINKVLEFQDIKYRYDDWYDNQPEVIEYNQKYEKRIDEKQKEEEKLSFCGMGLNKAGTLIEVELDGKTQVLLIGHINNLRGVCDDCTMFEPNTIVKRYKIVWSPKN